MNNCYKRNNAYLYYCTGYVGELMDLILEKVYWDQATYRSEVLKINIPEDLCAQYERPDREEVIAKYVSRFNREQEQGAAV